MRRLAMGLMWPMARPPGRFGIGRSPRQADVLLDRGSLMVKVLAVLGNIFIEPKIEGDSLDFPCPRAHQVRHRREPLVIPLPVYASDAFP